MKIIIKDNSSIPKYMQIVNEVINNVSIGNLKADDKMPSINKFSKEHSISRDTVEKAYKLLKTKMVIIGKRGKGTYINSPRTKKKQKLDIFINELSSKSLDNYNSIIHRLGNEFQTNTIIYNNNEKLLYDLIQKKLKKQDYFLVVPNSFT